MRISNRIDNDLLMCIARRNFFLSGEASYVHNFLTIAERLFLLVGPKPKIAKRCPPKK